MISAIIPTYNRASYLDEAIQSVLNQDYFNHRDSYPFELIVVDDGSTDQTQEVVESYEDRVKYIYQEHSGVSRARNLGLQNSRGSFIAFLDSDDLWKREKIRSQMSLMKVFPEAMVSYTQEIWIRRGMRVNPKRKHQKYSGWIFDKSLPLCLLSLSSTLFRKEIFHEVGLFDEQLPACEDYDMGIRVALKYPFHLISKPLIIKKGGHSDQLSRKYWGMDRFRVQALEKILNSNLTDLQKELVQKEIIRKSRILLQGCQKRNRHQEAKKYLKIIRKYEGDKEDL